MIPAPLPYPDELLGYALVRCCRLFNLPFKVFARKCLGLPQLRPNFLSVWPLQAIARLYRLPAEDLLWRHTPFPYATAFVAGSSYTQAMSAALEGGAGMPQLLAVMQNASSGVAFRRLCAKCIANDMASYGEAYWHRSHNLPGVFFCPAHQTPLISSDVRATGELKTVYKLPLECESRSGPQLRRTPALLALAEASAALLQREPGSGTTRGADAYRALAVQQGLLSGSRQVRSSALTGLLQSLFPAQFWEAAGLAPGNQDWAALVLRPGTRFNASPLKHLLIEVALRSADPTGSRLDFASSGPPGTSDAAVDAFYAPLAKKELQRALRSGDVLTTEQFLRRFGAFGPYRHRGANLPQLRQVVSDFRTSRASVKPLGKGKTLYRGRAPQMSPVFSAGA